MILQLYISTILSTCFAVEVQDVEHCKDFTTVKNYNSKFPEFAEEDGWEYWYVPDTSENREISSMSLTITKEESPAHSYNLYTIYQIKDYHVRSEINDKVILDKHDRIVSVSKEGGKPKFRLTLLKYEPKNYAYYYKCSETKTDNPKIDHRYILGFSKGLTKSQSEELLALDKKLNFTGSLVNI